MNAKKRQRSENWLDEDKIILKDLVKERVRVVENKNTDTNSNAMKVAAWNELKESFNCMCRGSPRTVTQLKAQWGLMKIKEKKKLAEQRNAILKTGGGPPPVIELTSGEEISSWLPNEFIIDSNEFDSDNINQDKLQPSTCGKFNDIDDLGKENFNQNIEELSINVDTVEASPPPKSTGPPAPMSSGSQLLGPKPRKIKKKIHMSISPAEQVAACEMECRRELHMVQLKNENLKTENLNLEQELLKYKIQYYKNKLLD